MEAVSTEGISETDVKAALKEALKEWLDEKFAILGKWSAGAFLAAVISALAYFIIQANGFHR